MERVISSLAETLWPATAYEAAVGVDAAAGAGDCPQVAADVLQVVDKQLYGANKSKLRLLLRLMDHRLPTLLLAGRHSLTPRPPFVLSVPEMAVTQRHAMLSSWARSPLADLRQAYKGVKGVCAAAVLSHIDPDTQSNPFFKAIGYTPGNALPPTAQIAPLASALQQEEVLASAVLHLPSVLAAVHDVAGVQERLSQRGFSTQPASSSEEQQQPGSTGGSSGCFPCMPGAGHAADRSPSNSIDLCYDAVVVGSGAGGGVTAAVLAGAGLRVLVLEKSSWVRAEDMTWLEHEALGSMYECGGFLSTKDGGLVMLAGSTLGGGTKINWAASISPPDHVRAEWAAAPHGLTHLAPGSKPFDAALDAVCTRLGVKTGCALSTPNTKLLQGLSALGLHAEPYARNCLSDTCSSYCNMGCRSGHKQSSEVWLLDAVRAGAHVLTGVKAERILTTGKTGKQRAFGVLASADSALHSPAHQHAPLQVVVTVHASLVISSCGSINTPALLLRSGISAGGNVGANLRLHPASGVLAHFRSTAADRQTGRGAVNMSEGVSMGVFSRAAANWESGGYGAFISVPACQPGLLGAISPDHSYGYLKKVMLDLPDASLTVVFTRDSGSGRVGIDKKGRPVVSYWPCSKTRGHLAEGLITAARALAAAGARRVIIPNAAECWEVNLDPDQPLTARQQQLDGLAEAVRAAGIRIYDMPLFSAHQTGSCRMGSSRRSSVCDPSGEVWGISGLYIGDGSALPTASGVNPMITIYGVAYMTAQGIARKWKQQQTPKQQQQ